MPRQTELRDVSITLGRDFSVARYIFPLLDRTFNTRYFVLDLGEDKMSITDMSQVRKIGDEIAINAQAYDWSMAASLNPSVFFNSFHVDPWAYLSGVKGLPDELRKVFMATNLFGRNVHGQKLADMLYHENLGFAEFAELRSMGFLKRTVPVSELVFAPDGTLGLKTPPKA